MIPDVTDPEEDGGPRGGGMVFSGLQHSQFVGYGLAGRDVPAGKDLSE